MVIKKFNRLELAITCKYHYYYWGEAPLFRVAFVCTCFFVCLPGWSPLIRSNAVLNNNIRKHV